MSDLTEQMVERMRVEIAQSAAADLLAALDRLPDGPLTGLAKQKAEDVRHLVASTVAPQQRPERDWWIVHVETSSGMNHVVVPGSPTAVEARDRALDALINRGRIKDSRSVITDTERATPGTVFKAAGNEPVIQL